MQASLLRPYLAIFVTIFFFSTIEVVAKIAGKGIDPIFMALIRFAGAGIILGAIGLRTIVTVSRRDMLALCGLGLLGVTFGFAFFHTSLHYMPASVAAVVFSFNPVIAALTASLSLGEHLRKSILVSLCLGIVGVYLVVFGFHLPSATGLVGPLMMLASATAFAIYTTLAKPYTRKYGPFAVNGIIFLSGSLLLPLFVRSWVIIDPMRTLLCAGYLMIFATTIAYVLFFWGLKHLPVSAGASIFYLKPVIASVLAVWLLGERLEPAFFAGLAVIIAAMGATGLMSGKKKIESVED